MDWTLTQLRTNGVNGVRELTGKRSTGQIDDDQLNAAINDFYLNRFPAEIRPEELKTGFSQLTSATDSGVYSVSSDIVLLTKPCYINGSPIELYHDRNRFFELYPDEKVSYAAYPLSAPGLAIGSSSKTAVATSAISYRISDNSYTKAAAETELSGDTVPQNKYGAWRLEIDADGDISIVEAGDNATGYDTAAQAIAGFDPEESDAACLGYVTAMSTDAGGFVPGTTELDDAAVTATYTDGFHSSRDTPEAILFDRRLLYVRPKASDIFLIEATAYEKPDLLEEDSDKVTLPEWGPVIAYGTAIEILIAEDDTERVDILTASYRYYKNLIERRDNIQLSANTRAKPSW